jgi:hypothetical protein
MRLTARIEKIEASPAIQEWHNVARRRELAHKMMGKLKTIGGMNHDEARAYLISQRVRACDIDAPSQHEKASHASYLTCERSDVLRLA